MKKLQNDFTSTEQSKRLLELGVPAWTADLYFYEEDCISNNDEPSGVIPYDEVYEDNTMFSSYVELPCWSVGRLIEILKECILDKSVLGIIFTFLKYTVFTVETLLQIYKEWKDFIDFSKLEE